MDPTLMSFGRMDRKSDTLRNTKTASVKNVACPTLGSTNLKLFLNMEAVHSKFRETSLYASSAPLSPAGVLTAGLP